MEMLDRGRAALSRGLGGLRRRLVGSGNGDRIVAIVGEGASDVVVGKNIIKIGTLVVPMLPAVIALLTAIVAVTIAVWYVTVPTKMSGTFNIAVADFSEQDATGNVNASDNGRLLSRLIFDNLSDELTGLPRAMQPVQVWHDSLGLIRKRAMIGFVPGSTPAERRQKACQVADNLGADVIIYGNLDATHQPATFVPEFCIHETSSDTGELIQIAADYQLGSPIPVGLPQDLRSRSYVNGALATRATAMSWLTVGVIYDLNGSAPTALDSFQKALATFDADGSTSSDGPGDGKEVIYYFIGREDLFLKRLDDGAAAFREAATHNANYARAHLGLGGVYFTRSQDIAPADRLKTPDLDNTLGEYALALDDARRAQDPQAELQARFALGSAYRLKGETYLFQGDYDAANAQFDLAIGQVKAGQQLVGPQQYRVRAYAALVLGTAYHQEGHIQLARGDK